MPTWAKVVVSVLFGTVFVVFTIVTLTVLAITMKEVRTGTPYKNDTPAWVTPQAPEHVITLEATFSTRSEIKWSVGEGESIVQDAGEFVKTFSVSDLPYLSMISVIPVTPDLDASVTCRITIDGVVRSESDNAHMGLCSS